MNIIFGNWKKKHYPALLILINIGLHVRQNMFSSFFTLDKGLNNFEIFIVLSILPLGTQSLSQKNMVDDWWKKQSNPAIVNKQRCGYGSDHKFLQLNWIVSTAQSKSHVYCFFIEIFYVHVTGIEQEIRVNMPFVLLRKRVNDTPDLYQWGNDDRRLRPELLFA